MADITVVKRDGSQQPFDVNKINLTLLAASEGLPGQIAKVAQIAGRDRLQHGHPASTFGTGRASGFYLRYRTGIRHLFSGNSGTSRGTRKNVNIYSLICVINMRLLRCSCWNCILLVNKDDARSKNINIQKRVDSDRDKLYNRRNSC